MSQVLSSVLRCLQGKGSDVDAVVQELNRSGKTAFDVLWRVAESHGVEFLMLQGLKNSVISPTFDIGLGNEAARENLLNNLELVATLHEISRESQRRGLRVFCFKGPVIASMAYGNLGLRGAGDLDFLIETESLDKAEAILKKQGFWSIDELRGRRYQEFHFHLPFERADGLEVELHWAISRRYLQVSFDYSQLWDRRTLLALQGVEIAVLSPEDHFLILCVHGTRHLWERLIWVCDLRQLLKRYPGLDWAYIEAEAQRLGCFRMVVLGHFLVCRLFREAFASRLLQEAYRQPAVLDGARSILMRYSAGGGGVLGAFQRDWACLLLRERWRDKLRFFCCFPWRDYLDLWEEQLWEERSNTGVIVGFSGLFKRFLVGLRHRTSKD